MNTIPELFKNKAHRQQLLGWYKTMLYDPKAEKYGIDRSYKEFIHYRINHMREKLQIT